MFNKIIICLGLIGLISLFLFLQNPNEDYVELNDVIHIESDQKKGQKKQGKSELMQQFSTNNITPTDVESVAAHNIELNKLVPNLSSYDSAISNDIDAIGGYFDESAIAPEDEVPQNNFIDSIGYSDPTSVDPASEFSGAIPDDGMNIDSDSSGN